MEQKHVAKNLDFQHPHPKQSSHRFWNSDGCIDIQNILDHNAWVDLSNMRKEAEDLDEKKLAEAVEQAKKKRILRRFFFVFGDRWKPAVGDAPNGW